MSNPGWVIWGSRIRRAGEIGIPIWWPALRWGAGLFETVGCDAGRPLLWEAHAQRLAAGVTALGWGTARVPPQAALEELLRRERLSGPAAVRVVALETGRGVRVTAWAAPYRPPVRQRRIGARLLPLTMPAGPLAGLKTCAYLPLRWAQRQARLSEADHALLLDFDGAIRETDRANLFAAIGGEVVTPPPLRRCLPGVMRAWCLVTLRSHGVRVAERDLWPADLAGADEVWLSSSLEGVVPVRQIAGRSCTVARNIVRLLERARVPAPGF